MSRNDEYRGKHLAPKEKQKAAEETAEQQTAEQLTAEQQTTEQPIAEQQTAEQNTEAAAPVESQPEAEQPAEKPKKKKMSLGLKIFFGTLAVLALLIIGAVSFISVKLGKLNYEDVRSSSTDEAEATASATSEPDEDYEEKRDSEEEKSVYNVLLIGEDNDNLPGINKRGNADGLMLLSVNPKTEQVVLTSIMRDTWIQVSDSYGSKITLVYHDRGTETLISAIESNFDIVIDNYALVNYLNIIEIIDALGGLDLEITANEIEYVNAKLDNLNTLTGDPEGSDYLSLSDVGVKHLNGKQIAAWLRIRYDGGDDQKRTERARRVIVAAKDKMLDMGLLELNSFSDVVLENITTDVTTAKALSLLTQVPTYLKYEFVSTRIPVEGSYTGDNGYIFIDYEANSEVLHKAIYGDEE